MTTDNDQPVRLAGWGRVLLFSWVGSTLAALVVLGLQVVDGMKLGLASFVPFVLWSVPFALWVTGGASLVSGRLHRLPVVVSYLLVMPLGLLMTLVWLLCPGFILGPWLAAFTIPLLPTWTAGAISGLVVAVGVSRPTRLLEVSFLLIVPLLAVLGYQWLLHSVVGYRTVEYVFVQWQPGPPPLTTTGVVDGLRETEITQLEAHNLGGQMRVVATGGEGRGPHSRVIIIMQHFEQEEVHLPIPDHGTVIYLQEEDGWRAIPPDVPTLQRNIILEPRLVGIQTRTHFWIQLPGGAAAGGGAFLWPEDARQYRDESRE